MEILIHQIEGAVDILMISEGKLNESFPIGQFLIKCFSISFRLDRNCHESGIPLYTRNDMPLKLLSIKKKNGIESFHRRFIEWYSKSNEQKEITSELFL